MSNPTEKVSYKTTLNLPQTPFPMEAKLVQNEPKRLESWYSEKLYERLQSARMKHGRGKWILHDGPPFANGDIHIGHVINKTLKDVILRFKSMQGYQTPYVPGWDCHGLPIEHQVTEAIKKEGKNPRDLTTLEIRERCFAWAHKWVDAQREQFKRLGILGEWNHPYRTMDPTYEASTLEVFAKFVEAGLVYRKLKPVPWSVANQTALADAELEYKDVDDNSVYVEFPVTTAGDVTHLLIWTTTPWTLPANLVVAAGPEVSYAKVKYGDRVAVVAADLVETVFKLTNQPHEIVGTVMGRDLAGMEYRHPFIDRSGRVVLADYVTTDAGTGLVHTAPGHGEDDYETGLREKLDVYSPVLANGRYDDTAPDWLVGKTVWEGNKLIPPRLKQDGYLFAEQVIHHSYPHDWRSKTPIIFRATEQWFVSMETKFTLPGDSLAKSLKDRAIEFVGYGRIDPLNPKSIAEIYSVLDAGSVALNRLSQRVIPENETSFDTLKAAAEINPEIDLDTKRVDFVPEWGRARLNGMLTNRPDWCISRQRAWGLPIPVFYNEKGEPLLTPESVRAVAKRVEEFGSDVWFNEEPGTLLGEHFVYPAGFTKENLRKEKDIFDVWFESGSSWAGVLQARSYLHFPADLYLEGSDQHRGWFQLSMLPALGATGRPPFKQVLTHGFIVKPDGTKVSKSDKEYVKAVDEINRHGADVLRLWCCSVDYQNDIPASPKALQEFGDKYRKIRNTLRYLLSNLYDFNGLTQSVEIPTESLDGWATDQLNTLIVDVTAAYESYQLHRAFRLLYDFCSVQISSVYGNALKDRLYCEKPDAPLRRRSQTVMYQMVLALTKLLAPMIVFTADEAWCSIPHKPMDETDLASVHLALLPEVSQRLVTDQTRDDWQTLMKLRESALGQLDDLKKSVALNKAGEAAAAYALPAEMIPRIEGYKVDLEDLIGVGSYTVTTGGAPAVTITDARTTLAACARCWKRRPDVNAAELCGRCATAIA